MSICLCERLTYDKLFRVSEPKRVIRRLTVKGPPLEIDSYQDSLYYIFNFKSSPSTTGLRHKGYIKFFKPKNKNTPLQHMECLVDCDCADFRYRWAWAIKQRGSSVVGPNSLNQAWNKAPRKTNPTSRISLCKHLLAAKDHLYGQLYNFPVNVPDTAEKLDKLTRKSQKMWTDMDSYVAAAKAREKEINKRKALRNVIGPHLPPDYSLFQPKTYSTLDEPMATEPVTPKRDKNTPSSADNRKENPQSTKSTAAFKSAAPPDLPKQPFKKEAPAAPTAPASPEVPPIAKLGGKSGAAPASNKPAPAAKKPAKPLPKYNFLKQKQNPSFESVVNTNKVTDRMNKQKLTEAIKLIEEIEDDFMPKGPGADVMGAPEDSMGGDPLGSEMPSEPPIEDSALGADTEGETALGLLTQIKNLLQQLVSGSPDAEAAPELPPAEGEELPEEAPMEEESPAEEAAPEDEEEDDFKKKIAEAYDRNEPNNMLERLVQRYMSERMTGVMGQDGKRYRPMSGEQAKERLIAQTNIAQQALIRELQKAGKEIPENIQNIESFSALLASLADRYSQPDAENRGYGSARAAASNRGGHFDNFYPQI